jgi:hypothetical protein
MDPTHTDLRHGIDRSIDRSSSHRSVAAGCDHEAAGEEIVIAVVLAAGLGIRLDDAAAGSAMMIMIMILIIEALQVAADHHHHHHRRASPCRDLKTLQEMASLPHQLRHSLLQALVLLHQQLVHGEQLPVHALQPRRLPPLLLPASRKPVISLRASESTPGADADQENRISP